MTEARTYAWIHFMGALLSNTSNVQNAAQRADAAVAEFDKRFDLGGEPLVPGLLDQRLHQVEGRIRTLEETAHSPVDLDEALKNMQAQVQENLLTLLTQPAAETPKVERA